MISLSKFVACLAEVCCPFAMESFHVQGIFQHSSSVYFVVRLYKTLFTANIDTVALAVVKNVCSMSGYSHLISESKCCI